MSAWCDAQNAKLGEEVYFVIGWPPVEEAEPAPQVVVEEPQVVQAPEPAPKRKRGKSTLVEPKEQVQPEITSLTFMEQVIAERTLGLDTCNAVCRNTFTPINDTDRTHALKLVARGLMGQRGNIFHLSVAGFSALNAKRKLTFGVVG